PAAASARRCRDQRADAGRRRGAHGADREVPGYRVTVRGTEPETYRAPAAPGPVPAPHQTAAAPAAARGTTSARAQ
ncbi:hypothetical protein AB0C60_31810, partial [Streptomyces sp. NPDC048845]